MSGLLGNLGVSFETTERGRHASYDSPFRGYTDEERALITEQLRYGYDRFVAQVARGRNLSPAAVDAIGRGHVWSGAAAIPRHLVDSSGGLVDAVEAAARLGGLPAEGPLTVEELPVETGLLGQLAELLGLGENDERAQVVLDLVAPVLRRLPLSLLLAPSTMQARLPADW